ALTDPAHEAATRELSVSPLADAVNKRPGAVSQHLAKLRMARLVTTRRDGTKALYRAANQQLCQLVRDRLRQSEHLGSGVPPHHRPSEDVRHTRQTTTRP